MEKEMSQSDRQQQANSIVIKLPGDFVSGAQAHFKTDTFTPMCFTLHQLQAKVVQTKISIQNQLSACIQSIKFNEIKAHL